MFEQENLNKISEKVLNFSKSLFDEKLNSVILYGSYARGDSDNESDIDLMIVVKHTQEELIPYKKQIAILSSKLSLDFDVTVSLHLQDHKTFNEYKEILPFFINVLNEGIFVNS